MAGRACELRGRPTSLPLAPESLAAAASLRRAAAAAAAARLDRGRGAPPGVGLYLAALAAFAAAARFFWPSAIVAASCGSSSAASIAWLRAMRSCRARSSGGSALASAFGCGASAMLLRDSDN
jgi:hypothetical protein